MEAMMMTRTGHDGEDEDLDDVDAREIMIVLICGVGGLVLMFLLVLYGTEVFQAVKVCLMCFGVGLLTAGFIELRALRSDMRITRQPTCGCAAELKNCDG